MSNAMSFSRRPTFPKAMALNALSPLRSIRAAMVPKRLESSLLSDIVGDILWGGGASGITAGDVESAAHDPVRRLAAVLRRPGAGIPEPVQQPRGAVEPVLVF